MKPAKKHLPARGDIGVEESSPLARGRDCTATDGARAAGDFLNEDSLMTVFRVGQRVAITNSNPRRHGVVQGESQVMFATMVEVLLDGCVVSGLFRPSLLELVFEQSLKTIEWPENEQRRC